MSAVLGVERPERRRTASPDARNGPDRSGSRPPAVDEGDPPLDPGALLRLLEPTPGRLGNTLRLVVTVCLLVGTCEALRVPEASLAGFLAMFVSKDDTAMTTAGAKLLAVFGPIGIWLGIVGFAASLSQPALRIPLIAALSFGFMFMSRAATMGLPWFLSGFLVAFEMTEGDDLAAVGAQPGTIGNTEGTYNNMEGLSVPDSVFFPPEEALLHTILWISLMPILAATAVIVVNRLIGQDAVSLLRGELRRRLDAVEAACAGRPGGEESLRALALQGTPALAALAGRAKGRVAKGDPQARTAVALVEPVGRLVVAVLAWRRLQPANLPGEGLAVLAPAAAEWRDALRRRGRSGRQPDGGMGDPPGAPPAAKNAALEPLAAELEAIGREIAAAFRPDGNQDGAADAKASGKAGGKGKQQGSLLRPDAFREPEHRRFATRVTLAAMTAYILFTGMDWSGIHTAMVTCFFVPQDSLGQTMQKALLRITGALLGCALGIATILFVMPGITDLWQLLVMVGAVTFVGGWVWNGSVRISYAGLQLTYAYLLTVLQGYGPTLNMETARDRVVGIVLGLCLTSLVFATLWPVRVADKVRPALAKALEQLADAVAAVRGQVRGDGGTGSGLVPFSRAVTGVRELMAFDPFERPVTRTRGTAIDAEMLTSLQATAVPVAMVQRLNRDADGAGAGKAVEAYHAALADWLRDAASAVRNQAPARQFAASPPPEPPRSGVSDAQALWYARLDGRLRGIVARLAGKAEAAEALPGDAVPSPPGSAA
ncbi:MAG: FUSC family protein [Gluconacetobacter diazotrophicus]|nr:FUSC family protein [Gluconacetobacter diazotrophicus]